MPPRQIWLFKFGCWAALASAALHVVGMIAGHGAPANDTERQLVQLMTTYRLALPGGSSRTFMDFLNGFSAAFAVFMITIGAVGLVVTRTSGADARTMNALAKVLALACAALLVISLVDFFIVPTICLALVAFCFACAAVRAPIAGEDGAGANPAPAGDRDTSE